MEIEAIISLHQVTEWLHHDSSKKLFPARPTCLRSALIASIPHATSMATEATTATWPGSPTSRLTRPDVQRSSKRTRN